MVALIFLFSANSALIQSLKCKAYSQGVHASSRASSDRVAIAIVKQSIANLDRRPWLQELHVKMLDLLATAHAKVAGGTVFFSGLQADAGLAYACKIALPLKFSAPKNSVGSPQQSEVSQLNTLLQEAAQHPDNGRKPGGGMAKANNVALSMFFGLGESQGKSDLFSLGVSLYQMVCGKLPLEGNSMVQLVFRIANEPPADTSSIRQNALRCAAKFISRALAKNMAERHQTGREMAGLIREYAAGLA